MATSAFGLGKDAGVLHNSVMYTVSVLFLRKLNVNFYVVNFKISSNVTAVYM